MKSGEDIVGPVPVAFVLNKERNEQVEYMAIASSAERCLQNALSNCMQSSVTINGVSDKCVVEYEFPDFELVPMPTAENSDRYYYDILLPVVNNLGLKPTMEIHSKEVVFAIMNDLPIELGNPEKCIRQRSEYADFVKSFSGGFIDLMGKGTSVKFPSGEEYGFGLKLATSPVLEDIPASKRRVPSVPVKEPKRGIKQ